MTETNATVFEIITALQILFSVLTWFAFSVCFFVNMVDSYGDSWFERFLKILYFIFIPTIMATIISFVFGFFGKIVLKFLVI